MLATIATSILWAALLASAQPAAESVAPASAASAADAFREKIALNPILLDGDPYAAYAAGSLVLPGESDEVCALSYEPDRIHYRLQTFATAGAAADAKFIVTHKGRCGTCSTLQDLAVYLSLPELTAPVRSCSMRGITRGRTLRCLEEIGFSAPCAETWYYSSLNTRRNCFGVCMRSWMSGEPATDEHGRLNDCMQCGEDASGAVFQFVAGRTRRRCGIRSAIDHSVAETYEMKHDYY